jgi:two-component system LytT family response regulator
MMKVLIVDDERPAREVLKTYLRTMPGIVVAGEAENGQQAVALAETLKPDLVLLDVQMPGMDGIQVAAALPAGTGIIFITAFDNYAIKAFEVHASDYILKPVMKPRLEEAIGRFMNKSPLPGYLDRLTIRTMFEYMVIRTEDISCVKVEDGLVFVYAEGIKYVHDSSLRRLEEKLDPAIFLRVHRNALVNKNHIRRILPGEKNQLHLEMDDGESVEVSRDSMRAFKRVMGWDI